MKLTHWFDRQKAFPDLLDYAAVVDSGIVEGKDGGLIAGWTFINQDQSSLPDETLNAIAWRVNDFLKLLGGGWSLHVNAIRTEEGEYPDPSHTHFPDPVTQAIDAERADQYGGSTGHFSTRHTAVLHWFPPARATTRMEQWMYRDGKADAQTIADKTLEEFKGKVVEFAEAMRDLAVILPMESYTASLPSGERVHRDGLLDHLQECITGEKHPVNLSPELPFLDSVLGGYEFIAGLEPRLDTRHIGVIGFLGYPQATYPAILNALDTAPHEFRWSTRFRYLDDDEAKKQLSTWRRKWQQKVRSFRDQLFNSSTGMVNQHAAEMVAETEAALSTMASGEVKYGYYTTVIVLRNPDRSALNEACRDLIRILRPLGFASKIETVNAVECYIGSLPGNLHANVRMPPAQTINLAHFLPLSTVWTGHATAPCEMYPNGSPALLYADTVGYTAFRLNLHVSDVGHTLIIGPTGTGKSTLLAFIAAQFRKYAGASIFAFDQGYSMYCLCRGAGGQHHDVAGQNDLTFCPLGPLALAFTGQSGPAGQSPGGPLLRPIRSGLAAILAGGGLAMTVRIVTLLSVLLCAPAFGGGGGLSGGSTEFTQRMNNSELIAQVSQQVRTYQSLVRQLEHMKWQAERLGRHHHVDPTARMRELYQQVVQRGKRLAYSAGTSLDLFHREHPGYGDYSRRVYGLHPTSAAYSRWDAQSRQNIQHALATVNLSSEQLMTEDQLVRSLQSQAQTAQTRTAVIQVGNDVALAQLEQSRRMQQLVEQQIALQAHYMAAEADYKREQQTQTDTSWERIKRERERMQREHKPFRGFGN